MCDEFTGGLESFDVEARTVGELIRELDRRFPGLGEHVGTRMAIAIDGSIQQGSLAAAIGANSEVYLIPRIGGG